MKMLQEQLDAISDDSSELSEELFRDVEVFSVDSDDDAKVDLNLYNPSHLESAFDGSALSPTQRYTMSIFTPTGAKKSRATLTS